MDNFNPTRQRMLSNTKRQNLDDMVQLVSRINRDESTSLWDPNIGWLAQDVHERLRKGGKYASRASVKKAIEQLPSCIKQHYVKGRRQPYSRPVEA